METISSHLNTEVFMSFCTEPVNLDWVRLFNKSFCTVGLEYILKLLSTGSFDTTLPCKVLSPHLHTFKPLSEMCVKSLHENVQMVGYPLKLANY